MSSKALLKIGRACDSECRFCHAAGQAPEILPLREVLRRALAARDLGCTMVVLSGGEPTLHPDILRIAGALSRAGLSLGLITNGASLSRGRLLSGLLEAGLAAVHLSLHGSCPSVHDGLTGVSSFISVLTSLTRLSALRQVELAVTTVVTKGNLGDLAATVELVSSVFQERLEGGARSHRLALVEPKGKALKAPDLLPDLPSAAEAVRDAIHRGDHRFGESALRGWDGFPICYSPGPLERRLDLRAYGIELMQELEDQRLFETDDGRRVFGKSCSGCGARQGCPGVYEGYLGLVDGQLRQVTSVREPRS